MTYTFDQAAKALRRAKRQQTILSNRMKRCNDDTIEDFLARYKHYNDTQTYFERIITKMVTERPEAFKCTDRGYTYNDNL